APARINHQHTAFESSSRTRDTSDQGRSRAAQESLCGVNWCTRAYPFVLRACYRVSRMRRDGSKGVCRSIPLSGTEGLILFLWLLALGLQRKYLPPRTGATLIDQKQKADAT